MLEVDGHRSAPAIEQVHVWLGVWRIDGLVGTVDANDVGAGVGQHHAAERARSDPGELDDPDAVERTAHDRTRRSRVAPTPAA